MFQMPKPCPFVSGQCLNHSVFKDLFFYQLKMQILYQNSEMKSMIKLINFCTSIFKDQDGCFKFYHHQHAIYYIKKRPVNQDRSSFFLLLLHNQKISQENMKHMDNSTILMGFHLCFLYFYIDFCSFKCIYKNIIFFT